TAALPDRAAAAAGPDLPVALRRRRPPAATLDQPRTDAADARHLTMSDARTGSTRDQRDAMKRTLLPTRVLPDTLRGHSRESSVSNGCLPAPPAVVAGDGERRLTAF